MSDDSEDLSMSSSENYDQKKKSKRKQKKKDNSAGLRLFDEQASEDDEGDESYGGQSELPRNHSLLNDQLKPASKKRQLKILDIDDEQRLEDYIQEQYQDDNDQEDYDEENQFQHIQPLESDPRIFRVPIMRNGEEQLMTLKVLKKFQINPTDMNIVSAFSFKSLHKGFIFVEAFSANDVQGAIRDLDGFRRPIELVDKKDIPKIFTLKEEKVYRAKEHEFVRVTKPKSKYVDDLAQVVRVNTGTKNVVEVRLVPRPSGNSKEVRQVFNKDNRPAAAFSINNSGELEYERIKFKCSELEFNIKPTPDELLKFFNTDDLAHILEQNGRYLKPGNYSQPIFAKGDKVKVISGEMIGLVGTVLSSSVQEGEGVYVKIKITSASLIDKLQTDTMEYKQEQMVKHYLIGDQVQIVSGKQKGIVGQVITLEENGALVRIITTNDNEILVSANDLVQQKLYIQDTKPKDDFGFRREDLIKLNGSSKAGVVLQVLQDSYRVLNEQNKEVTVTKMQCESKINSKGFKYKGANRDEFQQGSRVIITQGQYKDTKAKVLHVFHDLLFLFSEDFSNDSKIIVERADNTCLVVDKQKRVFQKPNLPQNLIQQYQATQGAAGGPNANSQNRNDGNKDKQTLFVGQKHKVAWGPYKGLDVVIRKILGDKIEVEINSRSKRDTISKNDLIGNQKPTMDTIKTPFISGGQSVWAQSPYHQMKSPGHTTKSRPYESGFH